MPKPVFRILISKFSGLPAPDPLVRGTDPDPSNIKLKQKDKKNIFCWRPEGHRRKKHDPELDPDLLVKGTDVLSTFFAKFRE